MGINAHFPLIDCMQDVSNTGFFEKSAGGYGYA
ncbi:MAG: hypothetical protein K0R48_362 [Gammaproteobacteria bacterium]|jgi:hypothetical protein|nr:hypothetical protein [Gammaproteobacteria bacterium]